MQRRPDIGLATRRLDWVPTVALEEGLRTTIGYFRQTLGSVAPLPDVGLHAPAPAFRLHPASPLPADIAPSRFIPVVPGHRPATISTHRAADDDTPPAAFGPHS
jgi:hypothetical protein